MQGIWAVLLDEGDQEVADAVLQFQHLWKSSLRHGYMKGYIKGHMKGYMKGYKKGVEETVICFIALIFKGSPFFLGGG